jgi:hypothetical protein
MAKMLKVGDAVLWRGCFGQDTAKKVKVVSMQKTEHGQKYGDDVDEMDWKEVRNHCVADLDNGHWAYGDQLSPTE